MAVWNLKDNEAIIEQKLEVMYMRTKEDVYIIRKKDNQELIIQLLDFLAAVRDVSVGFSLYIVCYFTGYIEDSIIKQFKHISQYEQKSSS